MQVVDEIKKYNSFKSILKALTLFQNEKNTYFNYVYP